MTMFDDMDKVVDGLKELTVFDGFYPLGSAKGVTSYQCKSCKGIELMGDFAHGSIWNLINHKCK
jgi:hypothetical protein